jgi:predicted DNA-binding protein
MKGGFMQTDTKEEKAFTVRLPGELIQALKVHCVTHGKQIREVVEEAIKEKIKKQK